MAKTAENTEREAYLAAHNLAGGDSQTMMTIVSQAERKVMRRLLQDLLGSDVKYWELVKEEIQR